MANRDLDPICVDVLSEMVKKPIKTNAQAWRVLSQLTTCFIDVSHRVRRMDLNVYGDGNGRPGMANELRDLTKEWKEIKPLMMNLSRLAEKAELQAEVEDQKTEENKPDSFQKFGRYVVDKILPPLIVSAVVGYAAFQFALYTFLNSKP